jgi:hypothetical protein
MRIELAAPGLPLLACGPFTVPACPAHPDDGRRIANPDNAPPPAAPGLPPKPHRSRDHANPDCKLGPCAASIALMTEDSHCSPDLGIPPESENNEPALTTFRRALADRRRHRPRDRGHALARPENGQKKLPRSFRLAAGRLGRMSVARTARGTDGRAVGPARKRLTDQAPGCSLRCRSPLDATAAAHSRRDPDREGFRFR